ncbi:MAG TPA: hypothetical protein VG271_01390 [Beijerinckiaceae bacterium]|jgi:hypothetical protein|nr:hypothetical protein [Beijerinckiaceae bacterium]
MKRIVFLLLVSLAPVSTIARAADCHIDPFEFGYKGTPHDADTIMTAKTGKFCGGIMRTAFAHIEMRIAVPAKNGAASTIGADRWGYRSRPGFVGADSFVLAIKGDRGTSNVGVTVDVTR